jgi:signal peptidase II
MSPADSTTVAVDRQRGEGRGAAMSKVSFVACVTGGVIALDQITKWWVRQEVPLYDTVPVIDGFFSIIHARNPGGAFSLFAGVSQQIRVPFFFIAGATAITVLIYYLRQIPSDQRWLLFAIAAVLGGALGNLIDRILLGGVTDFLLVYWRQYQWPAFNVADSSISIGVCILVGHSLFAHEPPSSN